MKTGIYTYWEVKDREREKEAAEKQKIIPMSMDRLLSGQPIKCLNPACGVALKIDTQKSQKALEQVSKLKKEVANFEEKKRRLK